MTEKPSNIPEQIEAVAQTMDATKAARDFLKMLTNTGLSHLTDQERNVVQAACDNAADTLKTSVEGDSNNVVKTTTYLLMSTVLLAPVIEGLEQRLENLQKM